MAGSAGLPGGTGIKAVLFVKVERLVVHGAVGVGMAFGAVRHSFDCLRVDYGYAFGVGAGIEKK